MINKRHNSLNFKYEVGMREKINNPKILSNIPTTMLTRAKI
jgi:hypothetical protein